jgi:hypothetical protein
LWRCVASKSTLAFIRSYLVVRKEEAIMSEKRYMLKGHELVEVSGGPRVNMTLPEVGELLEASLSLSLIQINHAAQVSEAVVLYCQNGREYHTRLSEFFSARGNKCAEILHV